MRQNLVNKGEDVAYRCFADKRMGSRLALRFVSGRMISLQYFQLENTEYSPEIGGIVLHFIKQRITIYGRNLQQLNFDLEDEMVGEIIERHVNDLELKESDTYISKIEIEKA